MSIKTVISTANAPAAIGPYSQAVKANGFVFVSGQLPLDPCSGILSTASVEEQTNLVMNNISAILKEAGSDMSKIVKTTIFVADLGNFAVINDAYGKFFEKNPPARACFQAAQLPKGVQLDIEVIAVE